MLLHHAAQNRKFIISGRVFTLGPTRCRSKTTTSQEFTPAGGKNKSSSNKPEVKRSESSTGRANGYPIVTASWSLRDALRSSASEDDTSSLQLSLATETANKRPRKSGDGPQAYQGAKQLYRSPILSNRLFGWQYHPFLSPTPPEPTTEKELVTNLVAMRNAKPPIPLIKIVRYHSAFPWLQSSHSFNTVIALSVRHTAVKTTRTLVKGMKAQKIPFTERTLALITRLRLRVAHRVFQFLRLGRNPSGVPPRLISDTHLPEHPYLHAWMLHQEASQSALLSTLQHNASLHILREHLTISHRLHSNRYKKAFLYAYRRECRMLSEVETTLLQGEEPFAKRWRLLRQSGTHKLDLPDVSERLRVMRIAYDRLDSLPASSFDPAANPVPSAVVQRILGDEVLLQRFRQDGATFSLFIRRLLLEGLRGTAFTHALIYLRHLCKGGVPLPDNSKALVLTILHMLIHPKYGCPSYEVASKVLTEILAIHPDIKPSATTLYVLLQTLRGTSRVGVRAIEALKWFSQRWENVEDEKVRRTIAKYGLKDRNENGLAIAWDMAAREAQYGTRWRDPRASFHDLRESRAVAFERIFTHDRRDKNKWIRMGLIQRQQGFVLVEDKARLLKAMRGSRRTEEQCREK